MSLPFDKKLQADSLNKEAIGLQAKGWYQQALAVFARAAELYRQLGDRRGEGRCTNGIGAVCKDLGQFENAKRWLEQALTIRREVGDRPGEALTLTTLGPVYLQLGQPQEARQSLAGALQLAEQLGNPDLKGQVLFNLGVVSSETGNLAEALNWFERSLTVAREQRNPIEENKSLNSLGLTCSEIGRFDQAIQYFEQSIALSRKLYNHLAESAALENLAALYRLLGEPREALRPLTECLTILMQTGSLGLVPTSASLYGSILLEDYEDAEAARQYFELALDIARKTGSKPSAAHSLQHLGNVYRKLGEHKRAVSLLEESRRLCREAGSLSGEAGVLNVLCVLKADLQCYQEAIAHAEEGLRIAQSIGNEFEEAFAFYNLAVGHDAEGRPERALELFESALSIFDRLRYHVSGDRLRTSFFDAWKVQNTYYVYVSQLVQRYRATSEKTYAEKAFLVSERRRARALLDVVAGRLVEEHQPPSWAVREIQAHLLDPRTLLLEYSLHENESFLFALGRDSFEVYRLPKAADIKRRVLDVRQLAQNGRVADFTVASCDLYRMLLGPVASEVLGKKLLIVPDTWLHYLPFQMLVAGDTAPRRVAAEEIAKARVKPPRFGWPTMGRWSEGYKALPFLVRQNPIAYVPSATTLAVLNAKRRTHRDKPERNAFVGFAPVYSASVVSGGRKLSALPRTKTEIERIASLFGSGRVALYLGEVATKAAIRSGMLAPYRFIHFATHGLADFARSQYSALVFHPGRGGDNLLYVSEIMDLRLDAELVVLSACETGLGKPSLGEGIIGLARAFLYAGAQSVCASLWEVADTAAAELMYCYYRNLIIGGMENAEALQAAQIELLESESYSAPYYWAPFILVRG
jgi:CHAT domain-containing protein/tetratricopeptide (TPR) repeat protein